jgi:hypothetical protein
LYRKKKVIGLCFILPKDDQGYAVDEYGAEPMELVVDKELFDIETINSGAPITNE